MPLGLLLVCDFDIFIIRRIRIESEDQSEERNTRISYTVNELHCFGT